MWEQQYIIFICQGLSIPHCTSHCTSHCTVGNHLVRFINISVTLCGGNPVCTVHLTVCLLAYLIISNEFPSHSPCVTMSSNVNSLLFVYHYYNIFLFSYIMIFSSKKSFCCPRAWNNYQSKVLNTKSLVLWTFLLTKSHSFPFEDFVKSQWNVSTEKIS